MSLTLATYTAEIILDPLCFSVATFVFIQNSIWFVNEMSYCEYVYKDLLVPGFLPYNYISYYISEMFNSHFRLRYLYYQDSIEFNNFFYAT